MPPKPVYHQMGTGTIGRYQNDGLPMVRRPGAPNGVRKRRRTSIWCLSPIRAVPAVNQSMLFASMP